MDQKFVDRCRQAVADERSGRFDRSRIEAKVLARQLKEFGPLAVEQAAYGWLLGEIALSQGDARKANSLLSDALRNGRGLGATKQEQADILADIYASIGRASLRLANYATAVQTLTAARQLASKIDGENSWPRVIALTPRLCGALYLNGDEQEADRLLAEGLTVCRDQLSKPQLLDYCRTAEAMLVSLGRSEQASRYRQLSQALV